MIEQDADFDLPDDFDPNEVPLYEQSVAEAEIRITYDDGQQEIVRGDLLRLGIKHGTREKVERKAFEFREVEHNGRSAILLLIDRNDDNE